MSNREQPPIWARPEPGTRKPRFSREQIGQAALAIADAEGFEAASMRRIAAELGAGTMTLYHYIQTKDDLIALMDDALMAEVLLPQEELSADWRAALSAIARRTRAVLLRHPWSMLWLRGAAVGPNGLRHAEQSLSALQHTRLSAADKLELIGLVDDYIFGHSLRAGELAEQGRPDSAAARATQSFVEAQLETGRYPNIRALAREDAALHADVFDPERAEARFERGLGTVLDGVAARWGLRRAPAKTTSRTKRTRAR